MVPVLSDKQATQVRHQAQLEEEGGEEEEGEEAGGDQEEQWDEEAEEEGHQWVGENNTEEMRLLMLWQGGKETWR